MKILVSAAGLTLLLAFASLTGCSGGEEECTPGSEGCPCTDEGVCLQGLVCIAAADECVSPDAGTGGTVGGTGGTAGGTGGTTGGSCTDGAIQGSCSTDNAMDCSGGTWTPSPSCASCVFVSPESICDRMVAFALDPTYALLPGGVIEESYSETGATAAFGLNVGEMGYWQLKFPTPITPSSGDLTMGGSGGGVVQISLEDGAGTGGCAYRLNGTTDDQYSLVYDDLVGCWGGFQPMTGSTSSSPASVLNVRVTATDAAITAYVTVWGVALGGG